MYVLTKYEMLNKSVTCTGPYLMQFEACCASVTLDVMMDVVHVGGHLLMRRFLQLEIRARGFLAAHLMRTAKHSMRGAMGGRVQARLPHRRC